MRATSTADRNRVTTTLPFFALAFLLTWSPQLPAALATLGLLDAPTEAVLPFAGLGLFGPLVAAVALTLHTAGRAGLRSLVRPFAVRTGNRSSSRSEETAAGRRQRSSKRPQRSA